MKTSRMLPMKLQLFAEGGTEPDNGDQAGNGKDGQQNTAQGAALAFDYEKLANIIAGKQSVTEDTILKNYFKQQGLSKEEADRAISVFKTEKAKNTPDVNAIQTQLAETKRVADQALIEKEATIAALELGIEMKSAPYVIKLADLSNVKGEDGKINAENVKSALNKVLEDVPQLKPGTQSTGGFRIGGQGNNGNSQMTDKQLDAVFGV